MRYAELELETDHVAGHAGYLTEVMLAARQRYRSRLSFSPPAFTTIDASVALTRLRSCRA